jgi:hypothetical protein
VSVLILAVLRPDLRPEDQPEGRARVRGRALDDLLLDLGADQLRVHLVVLADERAEDEVMIITIVTPPVPMLRMKRT